MSLGELLAELNRRGLEVWAEGDLLKLRGPKGAADEALRNALTQHKSGLLALLHERNQKRETTPIAKARRDGPVPLSYGQQRLWFLDRLEPGSSAYNLMMPLKVEGRLDPVLLERSFVEIIRRHEILRTRYVELEGAPVQIADSEPKLEFRVLDESQVLATEPGGMEAFLQREGERPFDLAQGPLVRVLVIDRNQEGQFIQVCLHHIAADVWARGILIRELVTLYGALAKGQPSPLPPLDLQYSDFAVWQRNYLKGEVRQNLVDYWRKKLAGMPPLLEVPADHTRPRVQTYAGGEVRFEVGPQVTEALKALSHAANATPFMGMLSAFFVFLHRLTGRDDLVLGANSINRSRTEFEPLVGFFVDNLVMRLDLAGNPGFSSVVERVRELVLEVFAHQDLPFDLLVEELKPPRNPGYNPLFQVVFAWSRAAGEFHDASGLKIHSLEFETTTSRFDLNLFVEDFGDRLVSRFVFNRDLFEKSTIQHYVDCFQTLLAALVKEPERPVSELPLLSSAVRERVLRQWNDTRKDPVGSHCLHELIEAQAIQAPDACAIAMGDWELTYGELDQLSDRLAVHLQDLGVGPEGVVGIYLNRSPQLIVSFLAVLKAGGAFLALDPDEPSERLRRILEDARPEVVLSAGELAGRLSELGRFTVVQVDEQGQHLPSATGKRLRRETGPDHLAYILYTSGSTGQPKGTEITHRSIVNYLKWCVDAYQLRAGSGSPVIGSVSFDGTLTSLFAPLLAGRALFLLPRGQEIDLLTSETYPEQDFSFIKMTPSHLRAFDGLGRARRVLERAHAAVLGGEGLHAGDLATWREQRLSTRIINEYGPTEAAVACCVCDVPQGGEPLPERIPIGRPITNTQLYILDRHRQPVPIGVPGELHIGGTGLARGYLRRPELTAERFIPNPFQSETSGAGGARLYRTGDLARYLPDGKIEFLGRLDDQLKIRGHRVEAGEIEAALARHPRAVQAAVVLQRVPGSQPRLVAYVQAKALAQGDSGALKEEFRKFLRGQVPDYMIPGAFVVLEELPLTPSGKIDRKALPPLSAEAHGASALVRTRGTSETERQLQALFSELLGLDAVSPNASFFEMGGHSLLAITLIARIRSSLGIEVPLNEIFERPTVEDLARWIDEHSGALSALAARLPEGLVALKPMGHNPPLFCVPPSAGSPAVYVSMARYLSAEQPVYGFQMPGVMDEAHPPATVEEAAALYVGIMRKFQPHGPYRIAGWSFGGIVVCEMARQLEATGEKVALLALIDGASLDRKAASDSRDVREAVFTGSQMVKVLAQAPFPRDYENVRIAGEWMGVSLPDSLEELLRRDADGQRTYLRRFLQDARRTARNFTVTMRAERLYTFTSYGGSATLFRANPPAQGRDSLVESVRRFARSGVEVVAVPGNHMTLIMDERNVATLALRLQESLDRVLSATPIQENPRGEVSTQGPKEQISKGVT
ncbi:amino acid adenylation domain-containing protein [Stigmatella sp. ncwal1]|uniref:Amino acid adenylation domain-containing protein n=1 Tax=Stigmatella ashevillensis TaxID=2995309 RepID=A0ABT5D3E1_9BACT|nr:amino acid adenylation domain-containing protein [Stigmatella ashevillena]MDC0708172.1 amino acid adenylation domain-containing protein [Stigmatella ashevillena]